MQRLRLVAPLLVAILILPAIACATAGTVHVGGQIAGETERTGRYHQNAAGIGTSPDSDGDGLGDWFEQNVANLDPAVRNDRYLVYLETIPCDENGMGDPVGRGVVPFDPIRVDQGFCDLRRYVLLKNHFAPGNVVQSTGENATKASFQNMVLDIASRADENDIVFVRLAGHGNKGVFGFADGLSKYEWIDEVLDNIRAKVVVVSVAACWAGVPESVDPLADGPCPRIVAMPYDILEPVRGLYYGCWKQKLRERLPVADSDKNGYPSLKELWLDYVAQECSFANEKEGTCALVNEEGGSMHCAMCYPAGECANYPFLDPLDMAKDLYLGDATVDDMGKYMLSSSVDSSAGVESGTVIGGGEYDFGTVVEVTAVPAECYSFVRWDRDASGTEAAIRVVMDRDKHLIAVFQKRAPSTVVVQVAGEGTTFPEPGTYSYCSENITVTAVETSSSWRFSTWEGSASGTSKVINARLDGDKHIVARFVPVETPTESANCRQSGLALPTMIVVGIVTTIAAGALALAAAAYFVARRRRARD